MNLVKVLSQYSDAQLRSIYSNAIDYVAKNYGGTRKERIAENNEYAQTQYTWVRSKRPAIKHTLAALNSTRDAMQTDEQADQWIAMVRKWAG